MQAFLFYLFIPIIYGVSMLPFRLLYLLSDALYLLNYYVIGYRKKVVRVNLKKAFPEKNDVERLDMEKQFFRNLTDLMVETIKCFTISEKALRARMTNKNLEIMNDYLYQKQKSYIVTGGHCGNYEFANLFMSLTYRHDFRAVYRRLTNPHFEELFLKSRTKFGTKMYQMHEAHTNPILWEADKEPFAFVLVNDQSPPPYKAFWTTFLKQDTGFFKGTEVFAKEHDLAVVYVCINRTAKRGHYELAYQLITEEPRKTKEGEILTKHAELLEQDILKDISNWLWSHKRWKHKKPLKTEN